MSAAGSIHSMNSGKEVSIILLNPALEKLEQDKLVTNQREFREEDPDRKHYALAKKGEADLSQSVLRWIKMMEMLEHYRETHEAIFRYKNDDASKEELLTLAIHGQLQSLMLIQ